MRSQPEEDRVLPISSPRRTSPDIWASLKHFFPGKMTWKCSKHLLPPETVDPNRYNKHSRNLWLNSLPMGPDVLHTTTPTIGRYRLSATQTQTVESCCSWARTWPLTPSPLSAQGFGPSISGRGTFRRGRDQILHTATVETGDVYSITTADKDRYPVPDLGILGVTHVLQRPLGGLRSTGC